MTTKTLMLRALAVLVLLPSLAWAQSTPVHQRGTMIAPNDMVKITRDGEIQDVGGLLGDPLGRGLNPFAVQDNLALGQCFNTVNTGSQYNALCLGHDSSGNGLITLDSYGGLLDKALHVRVNGTTYPFPGPGFGDVIGPDSAVTGHLPLFGATSGKLLTDSGVLPSFTLGSTTFALGSTTTASQFRTDIGLGSIATQDASAVAITGGAIAGVTTSGNSNITPHVATNAALALASTLTYPNGVWRDDFADGNHAGPLFFIVQSGTCSDNGMVDDGGSCVDASDGNSWKAVPQGHYDDIRQYGAVPDGSTDDTTAISNAITASLASGRNWVFVPAGVFKLTSQVTNTIPSATSFHLSGAGQDVSILAWAAASGGLQLSYTDEHASLTNNDLTFKTNNAGGGTGLSLVQLNTSVGNEAGSAQTSLTNVTFRGGDGSGTTDYWTTAFAEQGISDIAYDGVTIFQGTTGSNGDGFSLAGLSSASQSVDHDFNGVRVIGGRYGIIYGSYVQGVKIVNSALDEVLTSVIVNGSAGGTALNISNNEFGLNTGDSILVTGLIGGMIVSGNEFDVIQSGNVGIHVNSSNASHFVFNNNNFSTSPTPGDGTGILIDQNAGTGIIQGNEFLSLAAGVTLGSSATGWTIGPNVWSGNTVNLSDSASNTIYPNRTSIGGNTAAAVVGGGGTLFVGVGAISNASQGLTNANIAIPSRMSNFGCSTPTAPGAGQTITLTMTKGNADQSMTCTISGTNATGVGSGSVNFAAGDTWSIKVVPSSSAASTATVKWAATIANVP